MAETRKIAAILVADVVGYSRLAGADEEGTLSRLRALRGDLIDPTVAAHRGRIVKRTGDGLIVEFRSVVDAVRCAIEMQNRMVERGAGRRQSVGSSSASASILATWWKRATATSWATASILPRGWRDREAQCDLPLRTSLLAGQGEARLQVTDLGPTSSRTSPSRSASIRSKLGRDQLPCRQRASENPARHAFRSSSCPSPTSAAIRSKSISSTE